jgi:hypothetical protein
MVQSEAAPQRAVNKQPVAVPRPGRSRNHAAQLLASPCEFWRKSMMSRCAPTESRYFIGKLDPEFRFRFPAFQ